MLGGCSSACSCSSEYRSGYKSGYWEDIPCKSHDLYTKWCLMCTWICVSKWSWFSNSGFHCRISSRLVQKSVRNSCIAIQQPPIGSRVYQAGTAGKEACDYYRQLEKVVTIILTSVVVMFEFYCLCIARAKLHAPLLTLPAWCAPAWIFLLQRPIGYLMHWIIF